MATLDADKSTKSNLFNLHLQKFNETLLQEIYMLCASVVKTLKKEKRKIWRAVKLQVPPWAFLCFWQFI